MADGADDAIAAAMGVTPAQVTQWTKGSFLDYAQKKQQEAITPPPPDDRRRNLAAAGVKPDPMPSPADAKQPDGPDGNAPAGFYTDTDLRRAPTGAAGRALLPQISDAVEWSESRGHQTNIYGRTLTSPKGAIGRMQLMPGTAAGLGGDPYDSGQNKEMGTRYLGQMYDKYANWPEALAAYNAGPGRVDAWIRAGRPEEGKGSLPQETKDYVRGTLAKVGVADAGPDAVSQKRQYTTEDLQDLMNEPAGGTDTRSKLLQDALTGKTATDRSVSEKISDEDAGYTDPQAATQLGMNDQTKALLHDTVTGFTDTYAGPAQFVLEQTSPENAAKFTTMMNKFADLMPGSDEARAHPGYAMFGRAVGTTLGVTSQLIGGEFVAGATGLTALASRVIPQAAQAVGLVRAAQVTVPTVEDVAAAAKIGKAVQVAKSAAIGGVTGVTSYNADPQKSSRLMEGIFGTAFGGVIGQYGNAIMRGVLKLADKNTYNAFIGTLKESVGNLSQSTSQIKAKFLDNFESLWTEKNANYTLRNAAGEELQPGFPREEMGRPIEDAMAGTRTAGVAPTAETRSVAAQVDQELGGKEVRDARRAYEQEVKDYEAQKAQWDKTYATGIPANLREAQLASDIQSGRIPPPPVHPGEFEPPPVTPEQYSTAEQLLQGKSATTRDPKTQTQLRMMLTNLRRSAQNAADEAGMSIDEFKAASQKASTFYRENIAPVQKWLHVRNPSDIRGDPNVPFSGISNAQMFDKTMRIMEGHDTEAMDSVLKVLGDSAKPEVARAMGFQMLSKMENGRNPTRAMIDYVKEHRDAIERVGGRDLVNKLNGMAKIAQRMVDEPQKWKFLHDALTHHSWMQTLGVAEIGIGVLEGSIHRAGMGVGMVMAPWAGKGLFNMFVQLDRIPGTLPVIRGIGRMEPGSVEMTRAMTELQRRVKVAAAVTSRQLSPPVSRPVAPLGQAITQGMGRMFQSFNPF